MPLLDSVQLERGDSAVYESATVNKFGRAENCDNGIATDVWNRANATDDQDIWTAPTQARIHQIVSDDVGDAAAGVGARTVRVYGLTDWDTPEVSEGVTMNGTTNVPTTNAYVIVHRIKVLTKGATSANVGRITATADTDGTITAMILPDRGQTQMAIYGVPSTQTLYIGRLYGSFSKSGGATGSVDVTLLMNPEPDAELTNFLVKHTFSLHSAGLSALTVPYYVEKILEGPCIVKLQVVASANDIDVSGGFDALRLPS